MNKPTIKSVLELIEVFNPDATVEIEDGYLIIIENGTRFRVNIKTGEYIYQTLKSKQRFGIQSKGGERCRKENLT